MRFGTLISLLLSLAIAECAWAGGYTFPAKVLGFQSGMFSDLAEVQIWDSRELKPSTSRILRLELRYDILRLFYWYGFTSPFTKAEFTRCVELLAQHARKQDVFEIGFMGFVAVAPGENLQVRAFSFDRPKDDQQEGVCYTVSNRI